MFWGVLQSTVLRASWIRRVFGEKKKEPHTVEAQLMDCRHGAGEAGSSPLKRWDWETREKEGQPKIQTKYQQKQEGEEGNQ